MSTLLGSELTTALVERLSPNDPQYRDRAIVICTVDEHGYAHPAMLGSDEFVAIDRQHVRITTYAASRTARNLGSSANVTAILADVDGVFYIKARARESWEESGRTLFVAEVHEVLEDTPAADEAARVTSGIRFERADR